MAHSVIAKCDNANEKGRVPGRMQLASGTHAGPPHQHQKKREKGRGKGRKNPQKKKTRIKISARERSSEVEGDEKMKSYFFSSSRLVLLA